MFCRRRRSEWRPRAAATLLGLLIIAGAVLAYVLPALPFIRFLFGILGWILNVAIAVLAVTVFAAAHVNRARVLTFGSIAQTARSDRDIAIPDGAIEVAHDMTLEEGFDLLSRSGGVAVVADGDRQPIGIVSAATIMKVLAGHDPASSTETSVVEG